jgi:hypothetical protein
LAATFSTTPYPENLNSCFSIVAIL